MWYGDTDMAQAKTPLSHSIISPRISSEDIGLMYQASPRAEGQLAGQKDSFTA